MILSSFVKKLLPWRLSSCVGLKEIHQYSQNLLWTLYCNKTLVKLILVLRLHQLKIESTWFPETKKNNVQIWYQTQVNGLTCMTESGLPLFKVTQSADTFITLNLRIFLIVAIHTFTAANAKITNVLICYKLCQRQRFRCDLPCSSYIRFLLFLLGTTKVFKTKFRILQSVSLAHCLTLFLCYSLWYKN